MSFSSPNRLFDQAYVVLLGRVSCVAQRGQAWRAWREAVEQAHLAAREGDEYALDRDAQLLRTVFSAWVVYWEELDERARLINKCVPPLEPVSVVD